MTAASACPASGHLHFSSPAQSSEERERARTARRSAGAAVAATAAAAAAAVHGSRVHPTPRFASTRPTLVRARGSKERKKEKLAPEECSAAEENRFSEQLTWTGKQKESEKNEKRKHEAPTTVEKRRPGVRGRLPGRSRRRQCCGAGRLLRPQLRRLAQKARTRTHTATTV